MDSLGNALSVNRSLVKLDLGRNKFGQQVHPKFTAAIGAHPALSKLTLKCESPAAW